jgi:hypothetical protein
VGEIGRESAMIVGISILFPNISNGFAAYLGGQLVAETVRGVQEAGVMTSVKHYIGYEQETHRNPSGNVSAVSSNIDDKTIHELYLWPFMDAIHAGAGCIMCSYNRINNSYACQNSKTLNGLLKTELGFEGFVVSDWDAQRKGFAAKYVPVLTRIRHRFIVCGSWARCHDARFRVLGTCRRRPNNCG